MCFYKLNAPWGARDEDPHRAHSQTGSASKGLLTNHGDDDGDGQAFHELRCTTLTVKVKWWTRRESNPRPRQISVPQLRRLPDFASGGVSCVFPQCPKLFARERLCLSRVRAVAETTWIGGPSRSPDPSESGKHAHLKIRPTSSGERRGS